MFRPDAEAVFLFFFIFFFIFLPTRCIVFMRNELSVVWRPPLPLCSNYIIVLYLCRYYLG